jgi:predicted dienelactone hydrolase
MKTIAGKKSWLGMAGVIGTASLFLAGCFNKSDDLDYVPYKSDGQSAYITSELDQMGQIYNGSASSLGKTAANAFSGNDEVVIEPYTFQKACSCFVSMATLTGLDESIRVRVDSVHLFDTEGIAQTLYRPTLISKIVHIHEVNKSHGGIDSRLRFDITVEIKREAGLITGVWNGNISGTYNNQILKNGSMTDIIRPWVNGRFAFPTSGLIDMENPKLIYHGEFLEDETAQFTITTKANQKTVILFVDAEYLESEGRFAGVRSPLAGFKPDTGLYAPVKNYPNVNPKLAKAFREDVVYNAGVAYYPNGIGFQRIIKVKVYTPVGLVGKTPVVLMSHGGGDGMRSAETVMAEWAQIVASAGYIVVAIAHGPRSDPERDSICSYLGNHDDTCGVALNWDRPSDYTAVIDWLVEEEAKNPGVYDLDAIGLLGHSIGAGGAEMAAGIKTDYTCMRPYGALQGVAPAPLCDVNNLVSRRESRIKAVVAESPQGDSTTGFIGHPSFDSMAIPFFMATGIDDNKGHDLNGDPQVSEHLNRLTVWPLLPASGHNYKLYVDAPGTTHTFFNAELAECDSLSLSPDRCKTMLSWVSASVLAFLDSELRGSAVAKAWLTSGAVENTSKGDAALSHQ